MITFDDMQPVEVASITVTSDISPFVDTPVLIVDIRLQQSSVPTREQAQHRTIGTTEDGVPSTEAAISCRALLPFGSTERCRKPPCPYKHACPPVAAATQSINVLQSKCRMQSQSLPTPVIINKLALLLRDSRHDHDLIHNLTHGFTCGFRIPIQSSISHTI